MEGGGGGSWREFGNERALILSLEAIGRASGPHKKLLEVESPVLDNHLGL